MVIREEKCQYVYEDGHQCGSLSNLFFRGHSEEVNHYYCIRHFSELCMNGLFDRNSYLVPLNDWPADVKTKNGTLYRCYSCNRFLDTTEFATKAVCKECKEKLRKQRFLGEEAKETTKQ